MSRSLRLRSVVAAGALCSAALSLGAPSASAAAPDMFFSKTSGTAASAQWVENDPVPSGTSVTGNVHVGYLEVEPLSGGAATVFGAVDDFDCDPGELPYGGGHGEVPTDGACDYIGVRFLSGLDVSFSMDRKFSSAHLTGTLQVSAGHDGTQLATPAVDITWTGQGELTKQTTTERFVDQYGTYTVRMTRTDRAATVAGYIGPMNFTDDVDDASSASMGTYKVMSRQRS